MITLDQMFIPFVLHSFHFIAAALCFGCLSSLSFFLHYRSLFPCTIFQLLISQLLRYHLFLWWSVQKSLSSKYLYYVRSFLSAQHSLCVSYYLVFVWLLYVHLSTSSRSLHKVELSQLSYVRLVWHCLNSFSRDFHFEQEIFNAFDKLFLMFGLTVV